MPLREIIVRDTRYRFDLATQVLGIDLPDDLGDGEPDLHPNLRNIVRGSFTSAAVLAQKAKQFDDGLVAAVDVASQNGLGRFTGKTPFLVKAARRLAGMEGVRVGDVATVLLAACELGGTRVDYPSGMAQAVRARLTGFLGNDRLSKPLGFYTWSQELTAIFQQDRMLQTELTGGVGIEILSRAIHGDPKMRAFYDMWMTLVGRLTNPPLSPDLRPLLAALDEAGVTFPERGVSILPPSTSPENTLLQRLYGNSPIPEGFNLAEELVARIRSGDVSLKPRDKSGWYDHILWSIEPLLLPDQTPEAVRLSLGRRYRDFLGELFKGILALARETHVKQLPDMAAGCGPPSIEIRPELTVEPLATHYARRADAYVFVREVLESTFGDVSLELMKRRTPEGTVKVNLAQELREMEELFRGAAQTVLHDLGLETGEEHRAAFQGWAGQAADDPDLARDARMMVPVFYDVDRKQTKVWAFLGWASRPLSVAYSTPPKYEIFDRRQKKLDPASVKVDFAEERHAVAYPVTAEVYVGRILNRDEFRALCDRHRTRSAILEALK